jgi:LacI family transcriptional regulator
MKLKRNVLAKLGWYDHRILMGIARYAREADWRLASRYLFDVTAPRTWTGDGLLATHGSSHELWGFVRRQSRHQPTVVIGRNCPGLVVSQVYEDNIAAGFLAARHFLERGFRHFAWMSTTGAGVAAERRSGFLQMVQQAGCACTLLEPPLNIWKQKDSTAALRRWLLKHLIKLPKPSALFALDDQIASEVIELCLENNLPVPGSVAVMGVGNLELACECSHVPISSVDFDFEEIGYQAARMLDRLMDGKIPPANPLVVPPTGIVARQSTEMLAPIHPRLLQAVSFIKDNYHRPIRIGNIAHAAMVSRRMLSQLFARELRISPAAYVLQIRVERAKSLLRHTNQKVSQIARACGLHPERNLRRSLQRATGMSPLAFRHMRRIV